MQPSFITTVGVVEEVGAGEVVDFGGEGVLQKLWCVVGGEVKR